MPTVTFIDVLGSHREIEATIGETLLDIAWRSNIAVEGACEKALPCATCHVIVEPSDFGRLPKPREEELEMLDLASASRPRRGWDARSSCRTSSMA